MFNKVSEIIDFLGNLPTENTEKLANVDARNSILTKPMGSLGELENIMLFLGKWQNSNIKEVGASSLSYNPEVHVFAGNHGITKHGITPFPSDVTKLMVDNFSSGGACINQISKDVSAELKVHPMNNLISTKSFAEEEALTEKEMIDTLNYGFDVAANSSADILAVGEMGIGNTSSGSAMCLGLYGGKSEKWVGHGTGSYDELFIKKTKVIQNAYNMHKTNIKTPFDALRVFGGYELAAIVGFILGARHSGKPVVIDGFTTTVCGAILHSINNCAIEHCIISHKSCELGHLELLSNINKKPLLDLGLRLGEASGAALCLSIIKSAVSAYNNMATFEDIGIEV